MDLGALLYYLIYKYALQLKNNNNILYVSHWLPHRYINPFQQWFVARNVEFFSLYNDAEMRSKIM